MRPPIHSPWPPPPFPPHLTPHSSLLTYLTSGRSALFVAHRLSTVRGCDRIVVLRGGRVLEEGSHDQLMERG